MTSRLLRCWLLALGGWTLTGLARAQQPAIRQAGVLSRPVHPASGWRSLGAVLGELARQGRLPLSYSSSLVPLKQRVWVPPGPARPLGDALQEVLRAGHLRYGLLEGQLVLWPERMTAPPGVVAASNSGRDVLTPQQSGLPGSAVAAPVATPPGSGPATPHFPTGPAPTRAASFTDKHKRPQPAPATPTNAGDGQLPARYNPAAAIPGAAAPVGRKSTRPVAGNRFQPATQATASARSGRSPSSPSGKNAEPPMRPAVRAPQLMARQLAKNPTQPPAASELRAASPLTSGRQALAESSPRELAPLPLRPVLLPPAAAPAAPTVAAPAERRAIRDLPASAGSPPGLRLRGFYAHGEAWVSESLPVGATAKVGFSRAYVVLGAALAPNGRQTGPAFGLGLGTAGRARGRFTPNLDVLAWWVSAGHDEQPDQTLLTQLRPQLAWQVRRGGRLALVAGPTLNLATAQVRGLQLTRWDFAHDQWLWLDQQEHGSLLRLWPGVQLGLRF